MCANDLTLNSSPTTSSQTSFSCSKTSLVAPQGIRKLRKRGPGMTGARLQLCTAAVTLMITSLLPCLAQSPARESAYPCLCLLLLRWSLGSVVCLSLLRDLCCHLDAAGHTVAQNRLAGHCLLCNQPLCLLFPAAQQAVQIRSNDPSSTGGCLQQCWRGSCGNDSRLDGGVVLSSSCDERHRCSVR